MICLAATVGAAIYVTEQPVPPALPDSPAIHRQPVDPLAGHAASSGRTVKTSPKPSGIRTHRQAVAQLPKPAAPSPDIALAAPTRVLHPAHHPAARVRNLQLKREPAEALRPAVRHAQPPAAPSPAVTPAVTRWPSGRSFWPTLWRLAVKGPGLAAFRPTAHSSAVPAGHLPIVTAPPVVQDRLPTRRVPSLSKLFDALSRHRSLPLPPIAGLPALPEMPGQPSLPFIYLGKLVIGGQAMFFLSDGRRVYLARPGDHLGSQWAFDRARGNALTFIFLPGHARVRLPLPHGG